MGYTDLTNEFETRHLIEWQSFDELADNDADNYLPSGTKMVFCQASAPIGWTQQVINAKALRVVSGVSGGSTGGGAQDPSGTMAFNHSHTVNSHTHTIAAHRHVLDYTTSAAAFNLASPGAYHSLGSADASGSALRLGSGVGSGSVRGHKNRTANDGNTASGSATDTTSATNISVAGIKYKDVIICSKD